MVHFPGIEYRSHTSCITEDQKYQGALYKSKRQKPNSNEAAPKPDTMAHNAYVEDVTEGYEAYQDYEIHESDDDYRSTAELPEAPTPPSAVPADANVNVFDFLVAATPNTSKMDLQGQEAAPPMSRQLVRFEQEVDEYVDPTGYMVDEEDMVQYGEGPVVHFQTPAPKTHRKKSKDSDIKKDKKRKRLHIDTAIEGHNDQVMTDAPPVLHSGLTGGLNRLMRPPQFPPSPDYSGGDAGDQSPIPASPIKKSKHTKPAKPSRTESFGTNLKALVSGTHKSKVSKKRKHSSERKDKGKDKKKKDRSTHRETDKVPKLIEYRPQSGSEGKDANAGTMIVYKPRSDLFLSLCNKGPESERGCSVNKALKRYHRERTSSGTSLGKLTEEKELWRSLRMRRNDRGEIVLFSVDDEE
jgi:cell growth-regulating nucleolar protein